MAPKRKAERKSSKSGSTGPTPGSSDAPVVRRVAVLTGGGDCPGLNAVIRALCKTLINKYEVDCYGVEDGFHGLIYRRSHQLDMPQLSGILTLGGTILGSSNKDNPFQHHMTINGKDQVVDVSDECIDYINMMGWGCLVTIGGDGTLTMARQFAEKGINVVAIPKTIDNDLSATDYTFGFHTAVQTAVEAIDRLHTTAMSHHRVQVVEMMGRYAGHLTLEAGIAGGGDIILIPEIPYDLDIICEAVRQRSRRGKRFSIVVVAEGAKPVGGDMVVAKIIKDSPDPLRLGGIGQLIADQICRRTGLEARATVLGHLQRGGTPTAWDRLLSTEFGFKAAELVAAGNFGRMVAQHGNKVVDVSLEEAVQKIKQVDLNDPLIDAARAVGTCFGDRLP